MNAHAPQWLRGIGARARPLVSSLEEKIGVATLAAAILVVVAHAALAHEFKLGALELKHPWSRATPPGAKVAGGYVVVENAGDAPDRLIAVTAEIAGRAEIHQMAEKDGITTMRRVEGGLTVPAKGEVALTPGGFHVMFLDLKRPLKQGEKFAGTMTFERAGTVDVQFAVESMGATGEPSHAGH